MGDISVYLVDGASIRNKKETSFTIGSHWIVSKFIPKGQIWIDKSLKGIDRNALIIHEIFEIKKMEKGMSYKKAHALATTYEKKIRKELLKK